MTDGPVITSDTPRNDRRPSPIVYAMYGASIILQALPPAAAATVMGLVCLGATGFDEVVLPVGLTLYMGLEAMHYVYSLVLGRLLFSSKRLDTQTQMARLDGTTSEERLATWARCLTDPTFSPSELISGWFYYRSARRAASSDKEQRMLSSKRSVRIDDLQEGNVREWLSWALCIGHGTETGAAQDGAEQSQLDQAMLMLEAALSSRSQPFFFPPGYNERIGSMRLNIDPPASHIRPRPLLYYAVTDGIVGGLITPRAMRALGFSFHEVEGLTYWHRPSVSRPAAGGRSDVAAPPRTPLVFVHGVGIGPLPYLRFIERLCEQSDGPMLVIELPFVAQRMGGLSHAPTQASTVASIESAMRRHGFSSATFVGHSLGTVYLSWVARLRPALMASSVFIDPIVFLLHQPKVAAQFIYAKPKDTLSAVEDYFVKSEHSIVCYFHRFFFWEDIVLWAADLRGLPTSVVLSSNDNIVPVERVSQYLRRRSRCRLTVLRDARHGAFTMNVEHQDTVLRMVQQAQRRGSRRSRPADDDRQPAWLLRQRRRLVRYLRQCQWHSRERALVPQPLSSSASSGVDTNLGARLTSHLASGVVRPVAGISR